MPEKDLPQRPNNAAALVAHQFKPGVSGNPRGTLKDLPAFRTRCRNLSRKLLDQIRDRMGHPDVSLGDIVSAFKAVSDRGGFLPEDRMSAHEASHSRLVAALLSVGALGPAERLKLLEAIEKNLQGEATEAVDVAP